MSTQIREVGTDGLTRRVATPASQPGDTFPAGTILMWPTATPPSGWLICNGVLVARATYPNLRDAFAADGYIWGAGDGSTTMALPNFEDVSPIGAGNLYTLGAAYGEATHTLSVAEMPAHNHGGSTGNNSASVSGSTDVQGSHTHMSRNGQNLVVDGAGGDNAGHQWGTAGTVAYSDIGTNAAGAHSHNVSGTAASHGHSISSQGSGTAHNNLHPVKGIHYIIRAY